MPRLNPAFQNMVFFLYGTDPKTGKQQGPLGTGFLYAMPGKNGRQYFRHIYAITCQHVAPGGASIIRINTNDGRSRYLEFEPHEWQFMPFSDDLAAIDVTDRLEIGKDTYSTLYSNLLCTKEFMDAVQFGIGEDGFMLGLFADRPGKERNLIAARFGNVALLADDREPLIQGNNNVRPSHVFDMRSRPGFSGSPVFVYRTPDGDLRAATERGHLKLMQEREKLSRVHQIRIAEEVANERMREELEVASNTFLVLLGVHSGQYHDRVKIEKVRSPVTAETGEIREGDNLNIPNSMAVVVPAWRITELLDMDIFKKQRAERDAADGALN